MRHLLLTLLVTLSIWTVISCKKHHDDQVAPPTHPAIYITKGFTASSDTADFFSPTSTTSKVIFKATFNQAVPWRMTITGEQSFAVKTIEGNSAFLDSLNAVWNGSQDSLNFFRSGERCFITLYDAYDAQSLKVIAEDTIKIQDRTTANGFKLAKPLVALDLLPSAIAKYTVGYDDENYGTFPFTEFDPNYITYNAGAFYDYYTIPSLIPFARGGVGIRGDGFNLLKGTDQTEPCIPSPNYYIGRLASRSFNNTSYFVNTISKTDPDSLYVNVFVYGNGDLSEINVIVKEDDDGGGYTDKSDEQYQAIIKVDFTGWKLFSFNYSSKDFTWVQPMFPPSPSDPGYDANNPCKMVGGGFHANKKMEPARMNLVQFSLIARTAGGPGQAIIDYPTITVGKPKY